MANGKYEYPPQRRRKRRRNPLDFIILALLLIALLAFGATLMMLLGRKEAAKPQPAPETVPVETAAVQETEPEPETEPVTEAPTEAATEAPTEPSEEPTEEVTEETTEPPTETPTEAPVEEETDMGQQLADLATAQLGKEYSFGGEGPNTFDTSGLVRYCCNEVLGTDLPHTVSGQAASGVRVQQQDLLPGDVVFFWMENPESAEYVGIYVGDGKFVAARNPEKPVSQMDLNSDYFAARYLFACRYW